MQGNNSAAGMDGINNAFIKNIGYFCENRYISTASAAIPKVV
jgi:hypothetical protein